MIYFTLRDISFYRHVDSHSEMSLLAQSVSFSTDENYLSLSSTKYIELCYY